MKADNSADYNIFMSHGAVTGIKEFKMNEFNELFIPTTALSKEFNYIALGHYHTYTKIGENAFYSGSSERLTFAEVEGKKGCIEIAPENLQCCYRISRDRACYQTDEENFHEGKGKSQGSEEALSEVIGKLL